jgi:hypothetical protein
MFTSDLNRITVLTKVNIDFGIDIVLYPADEFQHISWETFDEKVESCTYYSSIQQAIQSIRMAGFMGRIIIPTEIDLSIA